MTGPGMRRTIVDPFCGRAACLSFSSYIRTESTSPLEGHARNTSRTVKESLKLQALGRISKAVYKNPHAAFGEFELPLLLRYVSLFSQ